MDAIESLQAYRPGEASLRRVAEPHPLPVSVALLPARKSKRLRLLLAFDQDAGVCYNRGARGMNLVIPVTKSLGPDDVVAMETMVLEVTMPKDLFAMLGYSKSRAEEAIRLVTVILGRWTIQGLPVSLVQGHFEGMR